MANVVVVGPGALGTLFAIRLAAAGHEVTMACRTAATVKGLQGSLTLEDRSGRQEVAMPLVHKPSQLVGEPDMILIATKCEPAAGAIKQWAKAFPDAVVVTIQNGMICYDLAKLTPGLHLHCTVGFPARYEARGHSVEVATGNLHIGACYPHDETLQSQAAIAMPGVAEILRAVAPVRQQTNMYGAAWTKLLINSAGMLTVLTGMDLGELMQQKGARASFLQAVMEGQVAGEAAGVKFETVAGFQPRMLKLASRIGGTQIQNIILRVIGHKYRRMQSSSTPGLSRGQKTEARYLNGFIADAGRQVGVPTPVNDEILVIISEIEGRKTVASPDLLARVPL